MRYGRTFTTVAAAALLASSAVVHAQAPRDLEQCDREAQHTARAVAAPDDNPSALPGASVGGSVMTSPGSSEANRRPNASGRISGSPGSPGTDSGAISGGGAGTRRDASVTAGALATTPPDTIAPGDRDNPVFQQAYRDCLRRRGF